MQNSSSDDDNSVCIGGVFQPSVLIPGAVGICGGVLALRSFGKLVSCDDPGVVDVDKIAVNGGMVVAGAGVVVASAVVGKEFFERAQHKQKMKEEESKANAKKADAELVAECPEELQGFMSLLSDGERNPSGKEEAADNLDEAVITLRRKTRSGTATQNDENRVSALRWVSEKCENAKDAKEAYKESLRHMEKQWREEKLAREHERKAKYALAGAAVGGGAGLGLGTCVGGIVGSRFSKTKTGALSGGGIGFGVGVSVGSLVGHKISSCDFVKRNAMEEEAYIDEEHKRIRKEMLNKIADLTEIAGE